jgi:hypothetical protein
MRIGHIQARQVQCGGQVGVIRTSGRGTTNVPTRSKVSIERDVVPAPPAKRKIQDYDEMKELGMLSDALAIEGS